MPSFKSITLSYADEDADPHDASSFSIFGTIDSDITDYAKVIKSGGVTSRYLRFSFKVCRRHLCPI